MIGLHKTDGTEVMIDQEKIETVERQGAISIVTTSQGITYVVTETPEEIAKIIEEAAGGGEGEG